MFKWWYRPSQSGQLLQSQILEKQEEESDEDQHAHTEELLIPPMISSFFPDEAANSSMPCLMDNFKAFQDLMKDMAETTGGSL